MKIFLAYFAILVSLLFLCSCGTTQKDGCTIKDNKILCADGTSAELTIPGQPGVDGQPGADGSGCTVEDTDNGAKIICDDGSEVEILDGVPGADGTTVIVICHKRKHGIRICTARS